MEHNNIVDYLKEEFGPLIDKFNNLNLPHMCINYKVTHPCFIGLKFEYLPDLGTDTDIANALKKFINVPFTCSVGRYDEKIWNISVTRIFNV